jgi:LPXTG-site transpeptidase (sortase) family protein
MKKTQMNSQDELPDREYPANEILNEEGFDNSGKKARRKIIRVVLLAAAILCMLAGVLLLARRPFIEKQRTESAQKMIAKIQMGEQTVIVDKEDMAVEGEGYEFFEEEVAEEESPTGPLDPEDVLFALPEKVTLTALGTISIESIELNLPLWDDAGIVPLRYGAGVYKKSVLPGEEGNLVILGHRMKDYGSIFNRLGEVKIGDEVVIVTMDGISHTYIVDQIIEALLPSKLPDYLKQEESQGTQLTLVTCTPTGVGSHRLLVIGHLAIDPSVGPAPALE